MRLLFVSNLFPDTAQPWRGLDNVTLLHALRQLRPSADIRVLCLRPGHGFWTGRPCPLEPRPQDAVFAPSYAWAPYVPKLGGLNDRLFEWGLRRALRMLPRAWQPDAVLAPWLFPDACGVAAARRLAGVPVVAGAQGSDLHHYLALPMRRRAILRLAGRAQRIVTRSADLRRRLVEAGASAAKVETIYNGVDVDTFKPGDKAAARQALGLRQQGPVLLYVGNFLPVKGLDLLIRSAALLKQQHGGGVQLVLIGGGPLEPELRALVRSSGLGDDGVIFAGRKQAAEVAEYMRAADVVCLTSHNEGVPNVVLEALASGRPMVATQVGGIAEILEPSPNGGVLVSGRDPADYAKALTQVLSALPTPGDLARFAARFSWAKCAADYWAAIDGVPSSGLATHHRII